MQDSYQYLTTGVVEDWRKHAAQAYAAGATEQPGTRTAAETADLNAQGSAS